MNDRVKGEGRREGKRCYNWELIKYQLNDNYVREKSRALTNFNLEAK